MPKNGTLPDIALDRTLAALGVDARLAHVNRAVPLHTMTQPELVAECRRLRGIIVAAAQVREALTVDKIALEAKLDCRETLLREYERAARAGGL